LSAAGHEVVGIDSLVRRRWDRECGTQSLVPIKTMPQRVNSWRRLTSRTIDWRQMDLCDARAVTQLIREVRPEALVHFAEQRSAPFSMIDLGHAALTQVNNLVGTLNLLFALRDHAPAAHLVKLGTMGEYGTPNIDIEEGFLTITHNGRQDRLPFPMQPGSFYHLSKLHDSHNIQFACRIWGLRATDLHQGVVYGNHTAEVAMHPGLATRFDYDAIWGTVLNRFCIQAALGLPPHYLGDTLIESVIATVEQHAARVDPIELEQPNVDWRRGGTAAWRTPVESAPRPVVLVSPNSRPRRPLRSADPTRASQRR